MAADSASGKPAYDAVVVGARVAGCASAAFLSRAGFRVLLLDRVRVDKPPISCPIYFADTLHMFRRLDVLPRVEALGAPPLRLYRIHMGRLFMLGRMLPYEGIDHAYSIRRSVFDPVLFEHVAALPNVETRLEFNVSNLLWDEGHTRVIGVKGSMEGGSEEEIRAEVVVGADGVYSPVATETGAIEYDVKLAHTCVYYAYYSNVKPAGDEPAANLYFDPVSCSAFITAESDGGLTVVSLSLPASRFEQARHDADALHARYAVRIPEMADRFSGAVRETPLYGAPPRRSRYRVPFGPGWVLVGDSGYYKDPITGQGIHDALWSAELMANAFKEYKAGGDWKTVMGRYQAERDRRTRALYEFTDFHSQLDREITPGELDLFRAISEVPGLANRYVSLFNGVTDAGRFTSRFNLARILLEWRARRLWGRVIRRPLLAHPGTGAT